MSFTFIHYILDFKSRAYVIYFLYLLLFHSRPLVIRAGEIEKELANVSVQFLFYINKIYYQLCEES